MPFNRFVPGNCCDQGCAVSSDDFTRADAEDPGSDWEEVSGDADIVSNALQVQSSSLIIHNTQSTEPPVLVSAAITLGAGEEARLILGYVDDNNYHYAKFIQGSGSGTIGIYQVSGGSTTTLEEDTAATVATTGARTFCVSSKGYFRAASGASSVSTTSTTPTGKRQGIGTNSDIVEVDDWSVVIIDEERNCLGCGGNALCSECDSGTLPDPIFVEIPAGVTLAQTLIITCDDGKVLCEWVAATYALEETTSCTFSYGPVNYGCQQNDPFYDTIFSPDPYSLTVQVTFFQEGWFTSTLVTELTVTVTNNLSQTVNTATYRHYETSGAHDCTALDIELDYHSGSGTFCKNWESIKPRVFV